MLLRRLPSLVAALVLVFASADACAIARTPPSKTALRAHASTEHSAPGQTAAVTSSSTKEKCRAALKRTLDAPVDPNDRLTREQWASNNGLGFGPVFNYTYDANGNLLTKKESSADRASYTWDVENRLVEATLTPTGTSGDKTTTRYRYDPSGIRRMSEVIAQTVGGSPSITKTRTHFLVDQNQPYQQILEDWTATATQPGTTEPTLPDASLQNAFVFGDDLLAEVRYAALIGTPTPRDPNDGGNDINARIGTSTGASALHYDGLGSTRLLSTINIDAAGAPLTGNEAITDSYAYTAFGESDLASTNGTTNNVFRFAGEATDPNLGWLYLRQRWMNPAQGRFIGMDSFMGNSSDPASLHKYAYAHANPVMYTDPSGNAVTLGEVFSVVNVLGNVHTVATIGVNVLTGNYLVAGGQIAEEVVYSKLGAIGRPIAWLGKRGVNLFYRLWHKTVKLRLGAKANADDLAHNLKEVGVPRPPNTQAHHIVAGGTAKAAQAQAVLVTHQIDINSPMNGVFLPDKSSLDPMGAIHSGFHNSDYFDMINDRIINAGASGDKIAVLNELAALKVELLAGIHQLNNLGVR